MPGVEWTEQVGGGPGVPRRLAVLRPPTLPELPPSPQTWGSCRVTPSLLWSPLRKCPPSRWRSWPGRGAMGGACACPSPACAAPAPPGLRLSTPTAPSSAGASRAAGAAPDPAESDLAPIRWVGAGPSPVWPVLAHCTSGAPWPGSRCRARPLGPPQACRSPRPAECALRPPPSKPGNGGGHCEAGTALRAAFGLGCLLPGRPPGGAPCLPGPAPIRGPTPHQCMSWPDVPSFLARSCLLKSHRPVPVHTRCPQPGSSPEPLAPVHCVRRQQSLLQTASSDLPTGHHKPGIRCGGRHVHPHQSEPSRWA